MVRCKKYTYMDTIEICAQGCGRVLSGAQKQEITRVFLSGDPCYLIMNWGEFYILQERRSRRFMRTIYAMLFKQGAYVFRMDHGNFYRIDETNWTKTEAHLMRFYKPAGVGYTMKKVRKPYFSVMFHEGQEQRPSKRRCTTHVTEHRTILGLIQADFRIR